MDNAENLKQILSTLSSITVRNEYCQQVSDDGGLKMLIQILTNPDVPKSVIFDTLKLFKTLAGNDNVKRDIASSGGIPLIVASMTKHMVREN